MKPVLFRRRQSGFTLVELMVALVFSLILALAMLVLLANTNRSTSELSKTNRLIENGRFALQMLQEDVAHAGYWGGFVPQFDDLTFTGVPIDVPALVPDPCLTFSAANWTVAYQAALVGLAVQTHEVASPVPSPAIPVCSALVTNPKPNTDVLVVRHADTCVPGSGACPATVAGELRFQVNRCGTSTPDPAYRLSNLDADLTLQERDCSTTSNRRRYTSTLYYVRDYAVSIGDGVPTLMRSQFGVSSGTPEHRPAEAVIEGIEGFRVEIGLDGTSDAGLPTALAAPIAWADDKTKVSPTNRGDGIPDGNYISCTAAVPCTAEQLVNAAAIKIYVLARSERPTAGHTDNRTYALGSHTMGPFGDGFKRQLFTQTVRLVNVSSRRETP